jgi:hypothetical protein
MKINQIQPDLEFPKQAMSSDTIHFHPSIAGPQNLYKRQIVGTHTPASNISFFSMKNQAYELSSIPKPEIDGTSQKGSIIQCALPPSRPKWLRKGQDNLLL